MSSSRTPINFGKKIIGYYTKIIGKIRFGLYQQNPKNIYEQIFILARFFNWSTIICVPFQTESFRSVNKMRIGDSKIDVKHINQWNDRFEFKFNHVALNLNSFTRVVTFVTFVKKRVGK